MARDRRCSSGRYSRVSRFGRAGFVEYSLRCLPLWTELRRFVRTFEGSPRAAAGRSDKADLPIPQRSQRLVPRMQTKLGALRKKALLHTARAQVLLVKRY